MTLAGPFVVSRLCGCKVMLQYLNNHILTQNLYYNYYYPNPKYLIIAYMDPPGYVAPCIGRCFGAYGLGVQGPWRCCFRFGDFVPVGLEFSIRGVGLWVKFTEYTPPARPSLDTLMAKC